MQTIQNLLNAAGSRLRLADPAGIAKQVRRLVFGEPTQVHITAAQVYVRQGRKHLQYPLPKTFQNYSCLQRPEEMADWLQAVLQEEPLRIRRCRLVLDADQAYLQTVRLPAMTAAERSNWLLWEGRQYLPLDPEQLRSALVPWPEENPDAIPDSGLSALADMPEDPLQPFLLVSVPTARMAALTQLAEFLQAQLEQVTVAVPEQGVLDINLLPVRSPQEKWTRLAYQGAIALCLSATLALSLYSGYRWYQQRNDWLAAKQELAPLLTVEKEYTAHQEAAGRLQQYRKLLEQAENKDKNLYPLLWLLAETIPEACWLEEAQLANLNLAAPAGHAAVAPEKRNAAAAAAHAAQQPKKYLTQIELRGCAEQFASVLQFAEKLKAARRFADVSVTESGERRLPVQNGLAQTAVTFLLKATVSGSASQDRAKRTGPASAAAAGSDLSAQPPVAAANELSQEEAYTSSAAEEGRL